MGWAERASKQEGAGHAPPPHRIMVCIPSLDHTVTAPILHLVETLTRDAPQAFSLRTICGHRSIGGARNRLVARFLESDAQTLWFIDNDTIPSMNTALLLQHVASDYDIWGGIYPLMARGSQPDDPLEITWTLYDEEGGHFVPAEPEGEEMREVGGLGTGCMLIKRRILEDAGLRLAPDRDGIPCLFRTTYNDDDSVAYSDDLDFCLRARRAGYRIWADPRVKWGHRKMGDVRDSFDLGASAFIAGYQHAIAEAKNKRRIITVNG